ncbi:hypothetical protein C8Q70DRAFT_1055441 [Cubamyces menziesii]|nr:hypothetical protein C8Q70DRAFT_1055441 [Cubamyces menziesii]
MPHYYADQDTHIALRDACFVLHASSFSDTHYDEYACVQPPGLCFIATDGVAQRLSRASKFRWNLQTPSPASYVVNQGVDPGPVTPSRASITLRPVLEMRGVHMLVSRTSGCHSSLAGLPGKREVLIVEFGCPWPGRGIIDSLGGNISSPCALAVALPLPVASEGVLPDIISPILTLIAGSPFAGSGRPSLHPYMKFPPRSSLSFRQGPAMFDVRRSTTRHSIRRPAPYALHLFVISQGLHVVLLLRPLFLPPGNTRLPLPRQPVCPSASAPLASSSPPFSTSVFAATLPPAYPPLGLSLSHPISYPVTPSVILPLP